LGAKSPGGLERRDWTSILSYWARYRPQFGNCTQN